MRHWLALGASAGLSLACSSNVSSYGTDARAGSVHALLTVERSTTAEGVAEASALATFARVPETQDADALLELLNPSPGVPEFGSCVTGPGPTPASLANGVIALLDAGEVRIGAEGELSPLAPRAFPTVSNLMSGVVYSSSSRAAESLPAGARYRLRASGGVELGALDLEVAAPSEIAQLTVDGAAFAEGFRMSGDGPIELAWEPGDAADSVLIEIERPGSAPTLCSFRDAGKARVGVPSGDAGVGRLSVRRVRVAELSSAVVDRALVRFEFERAASLQFGQ